MTPIVGYPTPGKEKAKLLLDAFCLPAGGRVVERIPQRLEPGSAAFYGVTVATRHLLLQAQREGRDWYYIDNAYFDSVRQVYFRVTRNRLQHIGRADSSDGKRFEALKLKIEPWRSGGSHVLLCPQSDEFMKTCAGYKGVWVEDCLAELRKHTQRELRVRHWNRNKEKWYASLPQDLAGCFALVTYSSASAISALMNGIPAFCTADDCIAALYTAKHLSDIENPRVHVDRLALARAAADNQWTVAEMRSGQAWREASSR